MEDAGEAGGGSVGTRRETEVVGCKVKEREAAAGSKLWALAFLDELRVAERRVGEAKAKWHDRCARVEAVGAPPAAYVGFSETQNEDGSSSRASMSRGCETLGRYGLVPLGQALTLWSVQSGRANGEGPGRMLKSKIEIWCW